MGLEKLDREKLLWFKDQLDQTKVAYTKQEACEIVERYLQRFDSELEQIDLVNGIKGRQGRTHGARENHIQQTIEREKALYEANGFEIPDIMNAKHLKFFRDWSGDLKKLPNIKMRKISRKGADRMQGEEKSVMGDEDKEIEELDEDEDDEEEEGGGDKELMADCTD
ncbi:translation machinery-associated protein 16 [Aplochiton taeniatus]